ncbi:60S ribosomal protein L34-like [Rhinolophus ferrumequinum]|uniref:60S ribosomal protein L34-like n=1 Tax=Rhinolophus ferrumequinum TaxID=59479 RepID=UPI00140F5F21|nr:60S ribosomal protein L34-like [Rhinolophus ferrumequinum]
MPDTKCCYRYPCCTHEKRGLKKLKDLLFWGGVYRHSEWSSVTSRRRLSCNTASNGTRLCRTPGNRVVRLYTKKVGKAPKSACGVCPGQLRGVRAVRPKVLTSLSKTKTHVSRAYAGSMCAKCVRDRVKRDFLIEGQKIVVKMLKAQAQSQKAK